jgi:hypothetical protein
MRPRGSWKHGSEGSRFAGEPDGKQLMVDCRSIAHRGSQKFSNIHTLLLKENPSMAM